MSGGIATLVGARPQFIKCSLLSPELRRRGLRERIIHTGQHYNPELSDIFFRELGIPEPDVNLEIGSDTPARQIARMLLALAEEFDRDRPDAVIVFGDTNSTLAGALAAVKCGIPLVHIEAGLRSFNRSMPEEHNRVVTDHIADLLICHNDRAMNRLLIEDARGQIAVCGDLMRETVERFLPRAGEFAAPGDGLDVEGEYALLTVHRAANLEAPGALAAILEGAGGLGLPVVFPIHPRTRALLEKGDTPLPAGLLLVPPVGYLEMLALTARAAVVLTDSGGLQKEALFLGTPCVTLRGETEWTETVELGMNILAGEPPVATAIVQMVQALRDRHAGETNVDRRRRIAPAIEELFGPIDVAAAVAATVAAFLRQKR